MWYTNRSTAASAATDTFSENGLNAAPSNAGEERATTMVAIGIAIRHSHTGKDGPCGEERKGQSSSAKPNAATAVTICIVRVPSGRSRWPVVSPSPLTSDPNPIRVV